MDAARCGLSELRSLLTDRGRAQLVAADSSVTLALSERPRSRPHVQAHVDVDVRIYFSR